MSSTFVYIPSESHTPEGQEKQYKKYFVHNLGILLSQTREQIEKCELDDDEVVSIYYKGGHVKKVNVNMDSYAAVVKDISEVM